MIEQTATVDRVPTQLTTEKKREWVGRRKKLGIWARYYNDAKMSDVERAQRRMRVSVIRAEMSEVEVMSQISKPSTKPRAARVR